MYIASTVVVSKLFLQREHFRGSGSTDAMGTVNRGIAQLDVHAHTQSPPARSSNSRDVSYNQDEEEWD